MIQACSGVSAAPKGNARVFLRPKGNTRVFLRPVGPILSAQAEGLGQGRLGGIGPEGAVQNLPRRVMVNRPFRAKPPTCPRHPGLWPGLTEPAFQAGITTD